MSLAGALILLLVGLLLYFLTAGVLSVIGLALAIVGAVVLVIVLVTSSRAP